MHLFHTDSLQGYFNILGIPAPPNPPCRGIPARPPVHLQRPPGEGAVADGYVGNAMERRWFLLNGR